MLYGRVCSVVVGQSGGKGREITGLRIAFSIQKGATKSPNKCTVKIWNLAPDSRSQVETVGNVLILKAGYSDDIGAVQIFAGDVTRALTSREGPDWITELELMDGHLEFRDTKTSLSFDRGASSSTVIRSIAEKFGLPIRTLPDFADRTYNSGFAFVGRARDAMDKACLFAGLEWSIQGREIQIVRKGGTYKSQAIVLSPDTGLIGSPALESKTMTEKAAAEDGYTVGQRGVTVTRDRTESGEVQQRLRIDGYSCKSLLQPTAEPGGIVQIKSRGIGGEFFRVEELTHVGDTHGQEWQTQLVLRYPK